MKKQGWLALVLLSTSMTANAFSDGFYTGAALGYSALNGKISNSRTNDTFVIRFPSRLRTDLLNIITMNTRGHKSSIAGSGCIGYGFVYQDFYFGAEFNLSVAKRNITVRESTTSSSVFSDGSINIVRNFPKNLKIKGRTWESGLDARAGILLTPGTLLFGKLGVAVNRFRVLPDIVFQNTSPILGPDFQLTINSTTGKTRIGPRIGAGLEQMLTSNLSIKLDYVYTYYRKFKANLLATESRDLPAAAPFPARSITDTMTDDIVAKMHSHSVMLGLNYFW